VTAGLPANQGALSRETNLRVNSMTNAATAVIDQALKLKASERAAIAERLLLSLDAPDPEIDAAWAREANARIEAHDRGEIESVPAEDVFAKYKAERL
jgi:putative addiction module component (TIGR02574 family)